MAALKAVLRVEADTAALTVVVVMVEAEADLFYPYWVYWE